jgi:TonB family protein
VSRSPWSILGIAAGADTPTIRRAYAQKLKVTHPEDDPEGFQALRGAYEQAMNLSRQRARWRQEEPDEQAQAVSGTEARADPGSEAVEVSPAMVQADPAPQVEPDPRVAAFEAHERACRELLSMIVDEQGPAAPVLLREALKRLLGAPAMDDLRIHADTERWLAYTLLQQAPRADVLVGPVVSYFNWRGLESRRDTPHEVLALLHRLGDLDLLGELRVPGHKFHDAYKAFLTPPRPKGLQTFATYWAADRVRLLLERMSGRRASMLTLFDAQLVEAWQGFLKRFHFPVRRAVGAGVAVAGMIGLVLGMMAYGGFFKDPYQRKILRTERQPERAEVWIDLCRHQARHALDLQIAGGNCDAALLRDSESLIALDSRAQVNLLTGQLVRARNDYQQILAHSPNDPRATYGLGLVLQRMGENEKGVALLRRAMSFVPEVGDTFLPSGLKPDPALTPEQALPLQPTAATIEPDGWTQAGGPRPVFDKVPDWRAYPSREEMERYYPSEALHAGSNGEAMITCRVRTNRKLDDCYIVSESPFDKGFGEAALKLSKLFEMNPASYRGDPVDNAPVSIPVKFQRP